MAARVISSFILAILVIGANCDNSNTTDAPLDNVSKDTGICRTCICKDTKVDCYDQKLTKFFSKDEWADLTSMKPSHVDLSENLIVNVTVIADLPIEVLNLSRCSIEYIEKASFRDLQEMKVLDLSYNKLTSAKLSPHAFEGRFSPEEFEPLTAMRTLNLAHNDLHSLNQDLFEHLPELEELDLSGNPLTTIDHVTLIAISSLPMLKVLRMRSCELKEMPEKFLHTPRYLERLDISDNQLTAVPQELEETKNLLFLNLNQNPIVELDMSDEDNLGFPRLRKLVELHMCNMPALRRIGPGALSGLESLSRLHLSFNPALSYIDPKALARPDDIGETYDWPIVKELYLQSNNLSEVDSRLLSRWDLLEAVDISNNPYLCDCSTQWMVDVLVPIVEGKTVNASEKLVCQEPIEMKGYTMKHLNDIHRTMRCVDKYGHRPERDGAILLGTLIEFIQFTETPEAATDLICTTCVCAEDVIDCTNKDISQPFELEDWDGLKEHKPITVDLSQNPLTSVTRISTLPIQNLNLSNCEIAKLEDASFIYLNSLTSLDLSHNKISTSALSRRVFAGPISPNIGSETFSKLVYLSFAYNDIHSLPQDVFNFIHKLTYLDMSGNPLGYIDQVTMAALTDLVDLQELKLSGCELETIPEGLFRRQRRLQRLDLSDNRFATVPSVLTEAPNLVYLNFGKNPIQILEGNNALTNLTKLQELRMCRHSKLHSISAGALGGLKSLVSLHICFNPRLTTLNPDFLVWQDDHDVEVWPRLKELYLNNNNLSTIASDILDRWDQLTDGDFSNNPYVCNCSNQWMVDVLVPVINVFNNESASNMFCKKPQDLRGMTFAQLYSASKTLVCAESESLVDSTGADMAIILGIMIGIFVTFPIVLVVILLWKKGYFARCRAKRSDPYSDDEETDAF